MDKNPVVKAISKFVRLDFESRSFALFAVCVDSLVIVISAVLLIVYCFFDKLGVPQEDKNGVKLSDGEWK